MLRKDQQRNMINESTETYSVGPLPVRVWLPPLYPGDCDPRL